MAYNRNQAARLLGKAEMDVFLASLSDNIDQLKAVSLRAMIRRTRTLRDKFQDLLRRQRVATRSRTGAKSGTSGVANERTALKVKAFSEALQRFEKQLGKLEAAELRALRRIEAAQRKTLLEKKKAADAAKAAARKTRVSPKAPSRGPREGHPAVAGTSESARTARHARQFEQSRSKAIQGHLDNQGRRSQARRDQRGGGKR